MTADPESIPPLPPIEEGVLVKGAPGYDRPDPDRPNMGTSLTDPPLLEQDSYVIPQPELPFYQPDLGDPRLHSPPGLYPFPAQAPRLRLVPHIGHAALFFLLALLMMIAGQGLTVWASRSLHLFGNASVDALASDARLSIPTQAVEYLSLFGISAMLFGLLWHRPFLEGIHWNASAAMERVRWLVLLGLILGFGVGLAGNFLPMPKDAPIVQDMMNTTTGAWLMLLFGITGAPLMEELAFRGFLLPALINAFRWMTGHGWLSERALRWIGVPVSVLLTSLFFATLHSPQVSHSWGPVLLIGIVSLVLCIVRLQFNSVLASAVVHAAYNFTLFAGILVTTGGFHHLEKLKG